MKKFKLEKGLVKDSGIMMVGVGGAQLVLFLFQFITRRLFDPEVFGVFDVYFNVLLVLINISCLRYEMAIILPKKRKLAFNLFALTFISSLIINLIIFIILILFKDPIFNLLSVEKKYFSLFLLLPLTAFIASFYQAINNLLIRLKLFNSSSFNRILRRVFEGSSQLLFGKMKFKSGLILGDLVGNFTIFTIGIFQVFKNGFSLKYITSNKIKYVLKKYIYLPKYSLVPNLLNIFSSALPIILINKFFGPENAGYYGLTRTVLLIPTALVGSSVSKVLMQRISLNRNIGKSIVNDIKSILYLVSIPLLIGIVILFFWSEQIFTLAFGENWLTSGKIARIFIIPFAMQFLVSPISIVFIAIEKIKLQSLWQVLYFLSVLSLVLLKNYSYNEFLKFLAVIYATAYIIYGILTFIVVHKYELKIRK
ncbi:MAG: oligosaccharide flippase family protein [Bacteroidales bacterium]|nr:oligosaccharide flippase family protein [Bacteroidales bacterium]